jgi:hypothetical protein
VGRISHGSVNFRQKVSWQHKFVHLRVCIDRRERTHILIKSEPCVCVCVCARARVHWQTSTLSCR